jgi:proteasome beta subunit
LKIKTLKGTTTVGLVVRDGVILAGDRRATAGSYIAHKNVRKVLYISDTIAVTTAGSVADLQYLYDILKNVYHYNRITGRPTTIRALASYISAILTLSKYFPYIVQLIIGGYDEEGARMYCVDYFGDLTEEKYIATGSGSPIAMGVIEDEYREEMSIDEAADLAKRAIISAIKRDSFTGTGVIVSKITKSGHVEEEYYITPKKI